MRNSGVGSWPARRVRSNRNSTAIVFEEQAYTYAQVLDRSTRLANALRQLGVVRGDRIAYLGPNHPSIIETLFAAGMLGAILLPLNTRLAAAEHNFILHDASPKVLIWSPSCNSTAAALDNQLSIRFRISLSTDTDNIFDYDTLLRTASVTQIDEPVTLDDVCMIQYTSGTSGQPKGVILTHGNVTWNCLNFLVDVDLTVHEISLVVAPLFHTAGMNNSFLPPFLKGGTTILMAGWNPEQALQLIQKHSVSSMVAVPTIFQSMAQSPLWDHTDLSSIRVLVCGAAPVPITLIERYQERDLHFLQGYGLTETSPNATLLRADAVAKDGSAGTSCFFSDLRILALEKEADTGMPGEVWAQGPNVSPGYWDRPQATQNTFKDGWLRTGDAAFFDDDGFIFIVDRIKDMFISGGENIYPAEVENAIYRHPAIKECAVVGIPDDQWGEVGRAFIVLKEGKDVPDKELQEFLGTQLAKYKIPKTYIRVENLPRTASGKLLKRQLRSIDQ